MLGFQMTLDEKSQPEVWAWSWKEIPDRNFSKEFKDVPNSQSLISSHQQVNKVNSEDKNEFHLHLIKVTQSS